MALGILDRVCGDRAEEHLLSFDNFTDGFVHEIGPKVLRSLMDEAVRPGGGRWNWKGLSDQDGGDGMDEMEQATALQFALGAVLCAAAYETHVSGNSGRDRSQRKGPLRDWADLSDTTDDEDWSHVTAGSAW